jgi:VirK protein
MRSCFLLLSVFLAGVTTFSAICEATANDGQNYVELEKAVLDGEDIRVTLDLSKCLVHDTDKPGPILRGSMLIEGYMIQSDRSIVFSTMHFTLRNDGTPVNEFLSFKVESSGKIDARIRFLNPVTYVVFHESEYDCNINEGVLFHW